MIPGAVERRVASGAVELAVAEAGDPAGPTVVLLHGYPDTKEVWAGVAAALARRFRVVAYDMRGAGGSTVPPGGAAGYDLDRLVDDALAVVDATAPGRPVHLVGHDWGSIVGWELAASPRAAGRLASFTSISGPPLGHVRHWVQARLRHPSPGNLLALAGQARRSWYVAALWVPGVPELVWRAAGGRVWPAVLARAEEVPAGGPHPAPTVARDGARGAALYRRNLLPGRPRSPTGAARVPVLLVVATRDRYVTPAFLDGVDRWAPVLRRRVVDAPHWVPRTHPDVLAGWISEFVADVGDNPPEPPVSPSS